MQKKDVRQLSDDYTTIIWEAKYKVIKGERPQIITSNQMLRDYQDYFEYIIKKLATQW